jgi:hypothetical protein
LLGADTGAGLVLGANAETVGAEASAGLKRDPALLEELTTGMLDAAAIGLVVAGASSFLGGIAFKVPPLPLPGNNPVLDGGVVVGAPMPPKTLVEDAGGGFVDAPPKTLVVGTDGTPDPPNTLPVDPWGALGAPAPPKRPPVVG